MKNLVLIMVFVLIMTVFIAFNYLLWDRENFQEINLSKTAAIDAFSKQLNNLEERNKLYEANIKSLQKDIEELTQKNNSLIRQLELKEDEMNSILLRLESKDKFINVLKQRIDLSPMKDIIIDWVEKLNSRDYKGAYELQYGTDAENAVLSLDKFTSDYKDIVKSIEIKSMDLLVEGSSIRDLGDCIALKVVLDVQKIEEFKGQFYNGINIRYFIFSYNNEKETWDIVDITYYY